MIYSPPSPSFSYSFPISCLIPLIPRITPRPTHQSLGIMSKGSDETSRFGRYLRAPLRAFCRARDMYVRGITGCAGRVRYGGAIGYPTFASVPRSYSVGSARTSSSDEDLRELIRAASQNRAGSLNTGGGIGVVPRSQSVAIGRIEEDKPCDFDDDVRVGSDLLFPRSRSCAVGAKRCPQRFA